MYRRSNTSSFHASTSAENQVRFLVYLVTSLLTLLFLTDVNKPQTGLLSQSPCPLPHCAGSPDMSPPTLPLECEQCVTGCNVECPLNTEEECTDHCIVVPCDDPCLDDCGMCTTPASTQYERGQSQGLEELVSLFPGTSSY